MLLGLIFPLISYAQDIKGILRVHPLASDRGLLDNTNEFIFHDSRGFMWISSLNGLNRFDGRRVKTYDSKSSLFGSNIQGNFYEDTENNIWFTTLEGINFYERNKDKFKHYQITYKGKILDKIEYTSFFLEKKRWLWLRAGDSLYKFDTKTKLKEVIFIDSLQAARFAIDTFTNGIVKRLVACFWAYKKGLKILEYDEQSKIINRKSYFISNDSLGLPALTIRQAYIENDTTIWLAGDMFLVKLNPQYPKKYLLLKPLSDKAIVRNFTLLKNNKILLSTHQAFLQTYDKSKGIFQPAAFTSSLLKYNFKDALQLYIAETQTLWVTLQNKGVLFTSLNQNLFYNPLAQVNDNFSSIDQIIEDEKKNIILSNNTTKSISYRLTKEKNILEKRILPSFSKLFAKKGDELWNITREGIIYKYSYSQKRYLPFIKDDILFVDFYFHRDKLLIGCNNGLHVFSFNKQKLDKVKGINAFITVISKDKNNNFFIGTDDGKIVVFKLDSAYKATTLKLFSDKDIINVICSSNTLASIMWVATAKGIVKINTETLTDTLLTEKDGLPSNYIQAILEDKHGNLWCSTNQGIFKYNPITKQSKLYTRRHGLSSDSYNRGAALLSSTGNMWFGGNNGVDVFHPDSIRDIGHAPQSAIVGLKIFDTYWKGDTAIEVAQHIRLKHFENTLTLELAAMEYTDPENNLFKVALVAEGDSTKWTDLGTQNHVTFPNLREGRYTFKLLTANSEGDWNEIPKTLTIDITPPYWRTWWFLSLMVLASIALISYIVYLRLSKVIALQKIRLNLYENLHDDIGSRLTAIVLIVDELVKKATIKEPKLDRVGTISRNIVANMRRLVWATAPENDALSTVAQQMQSDRRQLLPSGTHFTLNMDKTLENLNIGGDKRYQMLSIFNEALTNIAKYAEATAVETRIEIQDKDLIMTIVDNGQGFDPLKSREDSVLSSGHGLRNMQRRAQRIKGDLAISSEMGKGTSIKLSFPMHDETVWVKFLSLVTMKK